MTPEDLIAVAEELARPPGPGRASEARLRRAVSTTYYAIFHALGQCCADCMIGRIKPSNRQAWVRVNRGLQHGPAADRCKGALYESLSKDVRDFGDTFCSLQLRRFAADYDLSATFSASAVRTDIATAKRAISKFTKASKAERCALAAIVLFRARN